MKLLGGSKRDAKKHVRDIDLDLNLPSMKDLHVPHHHEEPESSSAGFVAGVVVGVLLGVVLSYLFGRSGGNEMVDQFAHRAEELKGTATEKIQHVRDQAEGEVGKAKERFGSEPESDQPLEGAADAAKGAVDEAKDTSGEVNNDSQIG